MVRVNLDMIWGVEPLDSTSSSIGMIVLGPLLERSDKLKPTSCHSPAVPIGCIIGVPKSLDGIAYRTAVAVLRNGSLHAQLLVSVSKEEPSGLSKPGMQATELTGEQVKGS